MKGKDNLLQMDGHLTLTFMSANDYFAFGNLCVEFAPKDLSDTSTANGDAINLGITCNDVLVSNLDSL